VAWRDGIVTALGPRMTACESPDRERGSSQGAVFQQGIVAVQGTGWVEPAVAPHNGTQEEAVEADQSEEGSDRE
jgi:hypothetical protein